MALMIQQETVTLSVAELASVIKHSVAEAVATAINSTDRVPDLWTAERIGKYLDLSARHVAERITVQPDFPKPVRLPSMTGKREARRWNPEDVIRWASQRQDRER